MILLFIVLTFAFLLSRSDYNEVFTKGRSDVLKALFPFAIILGHVYHLYPNAFFQDMRWAGPYVVGLFFLMSGYGLEYKWEHGGINVAGLRKRLKALLIPVVLPLALYLVLDTAMGNDVLVEIVTGLKGFSLVLPCSWFVLALLVLYLIYYLLRPLVVRNGRFAFVLGVSILILIGLFGMLHFSGTIFESLSAFWLGVVYRQNESKLMLNIRGGILPGSSSSSVVNRLQLYPEPAVV